MTSDLPQSQAREILATVKRQNQRLTTLVADLLLLARMEQQSLPVRQQCCLNDIISDLVEELASLLIAAGVTLKSNIRVDKPLHILGNEEQLYQLVSNLIVNAIQYTPKDGCVSVILNRSEHQALIQVADTGIGIAPQQLSADFRSLLSCQ